MASNCSPRDLEKVKRALGKVEHVQDALPEISAILKRPVSRHVLRRLLMAEGFRDLTAFTAKTIAPEAPPEDPLVRRDRERKEDRIKREHGELIKRLEESEARDKFYKRISAPPPPISIVRPRELKSTKREGALIVLASDWHLEENVRPEAVAWRNEYNLEISKRRADRFFAGVAWLAQYHRQTFAIRDVVLWLGGDLITGYIHPELEEDNDLSPIEATLFAKGIITAGIRRLLEDPEIDRILIPTSHGNHGRVQEKRRIKTGAQNSFEWLLYNVLAETFENEPRVEFVISSAAHAYVDVFGWMLHFTHGDEVSYQGGIGGLAVPLGKRVFRWDTVKPSHYHHCGHFHQFLDLGRTMVNGSLIGYTDYAMSAGCDFEPPQQASYVLDSRRGKCQVSPIWVDEEPPLKKAA